MVLFLNKQKDYKARRFTDFAELLQKVYELNLETL